MTTMEKGTTGLRMVAVFLLAMAVLAPGALQAGSADRRAKDAAAGAERAEEAVEELRTREPPAHERGERNEFRDSLERALRKKERAEFKALNDRRQAERAAEQKERTIRRELHREDLKERRERIRDPERSR
jgi:hypothetical protein